MDCWNKRLKWKKKIHLFKVPRRIRAMPLTQHYSNRVTLYEPEVCGQHYSHMILWTCGHLIPERLTLIFCLSSPHSFMKAWYKIVETNSRDSHLGLNKYKPVLMMSDSSSLRPSGIGWLWGQIPSHWTHKNISFGPLLLLCLLLAWRLTAWVSVGRVVHMLEQCVQTKCSLQIRYI